MYTLLICRSVDKKFKKMQKKEKPALKIIWEKLSQIRINPYLSKPLRAPLQNKRRVHIGKSFVLIYSIDEQNKKVTIENYDHHDAIYENISVGS